MGEDQGEGENQEDVTMKSLMTLVVAVIIGVSMGGAFLAGLVVGRGDSEAAAAPAPSFPTPTVSRAAQQARDEPQQGSSGPSRAQPGGEVDVARIRELARKAQSGELTEAETAELSQIRDRFGSGRFSGGQSDRSGQSGDHDDGGGWTGGFGRGLRGTIQGIDGNTITVETPQGPLQVTVGSDISVRLFSVGGLGDLKTGMDITVNGQRGDDGGIQANAITVIPEGVELFGGGGRRGGAGGGGRGGGGGGGF